MRLEMHIKRKKNYCSNLYKKEGKRYHANSDVRKITDNKRFWNTMKPLFSDKNLGKNSITLVEDNDTEVTDTLNSYFENAVTFLDICIPNEYTTDSSDEIDLIDKIIKNTLIILV